MTVESSGGSSIVNRVVGIITRPRIEWADIEGEPATTQGLYTGYVMILAAIPVVIGLISALLAGSLFNMFGGFFGVTLSPMWAIADAIVSYAVTLLMVYVMALLIDALAPSFSAIPNRMQAMKVAAYSGTAIWVASIAMIIPVLGWLVVIAAAVYTVFIIHVGLRTVMKAPEQSGVGYTAAVVVLSVVIAIIVNIVAHAPINAVRKVGIFNQFSASDFSFDFGDEGRVTVDTDSIESFAEEMERRAEELEQSFTSGDGNEMAGEFAAMLPEALPGFRRTESSRSDVGVFAEAEAVYTRDGGRIRLSITDTGPMGALTGLARVNTERETDSGYERVSSEDGRLTVEEFDRDDRSGTYGVMIGERFMVEADGDDVTMEELKAAVEAVPLARLESLAEG
jgi:hypothetical protein